METKNNNIAVATEIERSGYEDIKIGKSTYSVKVHFGKFPLETILRARVLAERDNTEGIR